ncbi:MAG TPA: hypothetical protein O0X42_00880 [Methanocorpusculum sp.]|nr:hypothetical protein [Methanocorpusculum sp.]
MMNTRRYRPFYYLSFIAIALFLIYTIILLNVTDVGIDSSLRRARLLASGLSFIFSIIVAVKNPEENLFQLFCISMACTFMGDIYFTLHNYIFGITADYFFIFLSFFGTISFMTLILAGLLKRTEPVNKYLPLLAIIPAGIITVLIWIIGKLPFTTVVYLIVVSVAAYYACKLLMSKIGKHFIFLVCCMIVYAGFVIFWIMSMTMEFNPILLLFLEGVYVVAPLLFLPALGMGLDRCQK